MTITSFSLVTKGPALGIRHLQVLFLFTCATLVMLQQMNMSVAIVAITNSNSSNLDYPEYHLTGQQKSYILSSTFWGCCFTQLLGGYFSSRFGAKMLLFVISLATGLLSVVTPFSIAWGGWKLLFGVRLLQGLVMGGMWPCLYTHLAKCSFYVPGYVGIVWCLLWLRYGANSPSESLFISLAERKYIELSLEQSNAPKGEIPPVPWRHILTSRPFLVLAFCKMSQACSFYTLMQQIPRYIHGIFRYSIWANALLSALPFVIMLMFSYFFIFLAEYLTQRRNIPLPILRKTINSYASWTPAIALVALTYVSDQNVAGIICCLVAAVAAISGQAIGCSLNHVDLAPNFAGLLFGISNTLMSGAGVISPLIIGFVVTNESDRTQWRSVFLGIAAVLFVGNLLYLIFGEMTVQPWNGPKPVETGTAVENQTAGPMPAPDGPPSMEKFTYF
ncbi:GL11389 [Drosophila persimilis]|uniref:GL11389 n=1 Tax=Drosophila persimilis TaxID=7234 RepID=B4GAI7_DROPE|nr:GL11389 [Drosophila persimilis]